MCAEIHSLMMLNNEAQGHLSNISFPITQCDFRKIYYGVNNTGDLNCVLSIVV